MWDLTPSSIVIDRASVDQGTELVAVCRRPVRT